VDIVTVASVAPGLAAASQSGFAVGHREGHSEGMAEGALLTIALVFAGMTGIYFWMGSRPSQLPTTQIQGGLL
jgi:hypothetical protein